MCVFQFLGNRWQALLLLSVHRAGPEDLPDAGAVRVCGYALNFLLSNSAVVFPDLKEPCLSSFSLLSIDIEVLECLQRPFDVKQYSMDIPNLGFPQEGGGSAVGRKHLEPEAATVPHVTQVSTVGSHVTEEECPVSIAGGHEEVTGDHVAEEGHVSTAGGHVSTAGGHMTEGQTTGAYKRRKLTRPTLSSVAMYTAQPCKNIPGHTGYLTFATLHTKHSGASSVSPPTTCSSRVID